MERIKVFCLKLDEQIKDIIEKILKNKKDIDGKVELKMVEEFPEKFDRNDMIILKFEDDQPDMILNKIYLYKGKLNAQIVKHAQENSVYAIFCIERFYGERMEYEEIARFESVMKKLIRNKLNSRFLEGEMYKEINWKIEISKKDEKFISMFSDENMRETIFKANRIVESIKPIAKEFKKFRESIKGDLKKLRDAENSSQIPKDVASCFQSIEEKSSNITYTKLPSIMITGLTGSGKTLFAKYIAKKFLEDDMSNFARVPIVNMGNEIVDSELFGSFPGAYTGSLYKTGKILANAGGIIFLDEIGEISEKIQAKLLAYFDDMRIIIDGYSDPHGLKVPVLVIAATNKDLEKEINIGNFRQDLFERFDYSIRIPSLKERKSDFRYILSFVLQDQTISLGKDKNIKKISLKAIEKFEKHDYSGNFRELENLVREVIMNAYIDGRDCIFEKDIPLKCDI